jgi:hypothetical protein
MRLSPALGEWALPIVPKPIQGSLLLETIDRVQMGGLRAVPPPSAAPAR